MLRLGISNPCSKRRVTYLTLIAHSPCHQVCPMYPTIALCEEFLADPEEKRPIVMCEYTHAMGNSNGKYVPVFRWPGGQRWAKFR